MVLAPKRLLLVAETLEDSAIVGEFIIQGDQDQCALLMPIGTQDLQQRWGAASTLLPDSRQFVSQRKTSARIDARHWGEALLQALQDLPSSERDKAAFEGLDAPMLRRAIEESAIPSQLKRIIFIASDQNPPHRDDTIFFANVLQHWIKGGKSVLNRQIIEEPMVLTLRHAPHIVSAVTQQIEEQLSSSVIGCSRLVVVAAGGTPAMTYGTMFAALTTGIPVRHIQVPLGQPVIEIDINELLHRVVRH